MTKKEKEQEAFNAGVVFERNRIIDLITEQIQSCPNGIDDGCPGCQQDMAFINVLLSQFEAISEDNSQTLQGC